MERYNEYKDSGVQWLGEIPSHWEVKRLASYFIERRTKVSDKDYEPLSVTKNGIFPQLENVAKTNDGDNRKLVLKGDFVINSRSDRKGSSGVSKYDGSVSLINIVLNPRSNVIPDYCNYILKGYSFIEEYYRNGRGIVADLWTTRYDEMKTIKICMPPVIEQQAIVSYLDTATAKIDEAIAQQQKMIDLLNERKQIIINNAVTKGLNPDAPMKDSGVDWIGKIPEYWMTRRMRYLCKIKTGDKDTINRVDEGKYPFYVRSPKVERINSYTFDGEAVLMAGDGVGAGKVFHYVNGKFGCHQRVYIFHDIKNINGEYLYFYMKSLFKHTIEQLSAKSTVDSVRLNMIQDFIVAIPTNEEQTSILSYLHKQIEKFDVAIANATKQISLLQERKQIIINDVVTGKVKVS